MRCSACSTWKRLSRRLPAPVCEVCTKAPAFSRSYTSGRISKGGSQESPLAFLPPCGRAALSTYTPQRPTGMQALSEDTGMGGARHQFPLTRWSVIEGARSPQPEQRQRALDVLVSAYWKPFYKYIRLHWGKPNEEAKDLTQDFFARLIEKSLLDRFDPAKAGLRTYLRVYVDGLVMNTDKAAQRQKRGGDVAILPMDFTSAEGELLEFGQPQPRR